MTIYHTFIDDTIGDGSTTIAGIQENASVYGIGVTSTYGDITADNINVGVITATTIVGQLVGGAAQIQDGAEIVGLVTFTNTFVQVGSPDADGQPGAAVTISPYGLNISGITTISTLYSDYVGVTTGLRIGTGEGLDGVLNHNGMDARRGPVISGSITNPGSGYVNGTYTNVLFTGGSGGQFRADVEVTSNTVTTVTLTDEGWGYYSGDVLTPDVATLPTSETAMEYTLTSVRNVDAVFYGNPVRIRLQNSDTTTAANQEMGSILFGVRDAGTGGAGDKARILARSRSTTGGGYFLFQTSANAGEPVDTLRLLDGSGLFYVNLTVTGALSKGSGTFKIDHPLEEKKDTHHLVHSFIEGPRADLIYRGKVQLVDGSASVNIDEYCGMTEGTFDALCREVQCFTSNETNWDPVKGSVSGNILTITCKNSSSTDTISWMVIGERKDKHMYDTDWTDENGKPILEPLKESETP